MNCDEGRLEIFPQDICEINLSGPGGPGVSSPRGKLHLQHYLLLGVSERTVLFGKTILPTSFLAPQEAT